MLTIAAAKKLSRDQYGFTGLITTPDANSKLAKSIGYYNAGISLAQARLSGHNMCSGSTPKCREACLGGTGRAEMVPMIEQARIARTKLYATDKDTFWNILEPQLHAVDRKAKRLDIPVAFRPNVLSDQPWHLRFPQLFTDFAHWNFYSYTKVRSKISQFIDGDLPPNYHITYSYNERVKMDYVRFCVSSGINVAVPFYDAKTLKPTIPTEWEGFRVIDGDQSDLRFLDPQGVIVGLSVKLPKKKTDAIKRIKKSKGFFVGV